MKKKLLMMMVIVSVMTLFSTVAFAGKTEWKNKNYDATAIKKIAIITEIPEASLSSIDGYYVDRSCADFLMDWCISNGLLSDTTMTAEKKYMAINKKYQDIKASDPEKAWDLLVAYTKSRYTAMLQVKIERYGFDETYHEGYTYTVTEEERVRVQSSDGSWTTVKYPVQKERYVEPYTSKEAVVVLDLSLRDMNTDEVIFARREERRSDGGLFGSPNPEGVMKKVCEGYIKDLSKMIKG